MSVTLPAIYEQGIFRPLEPFVLPEASRVKLQILDEQSDGNELAFQRSLLEIHRLLNSVEQNWPNLLVRQVFAQLIADQLRTLWEFAPSTLDELIGMLVLSASHIDAKQLTREQIQALQFGVSLLSHGQATEADLDDLQDRCILAGIPPALVMSEAIVQSYLDEL